MNGTQRSVREAWSRASSFLREAGLEEHDRQAELLIQHVLGWSSTSYWLGLADPFPAEAGERLHGLLERKAAGEPLQYITGEQEFFGLTFAVDPSVLIPRPETELLVERLLADSARLGREEDGGSAWTAADIGTGSGVIPVTLAVRQPNWRLAAVDISGAALETARRNAERHGVAERIVFLEGDLLAPLEKAGWRPDALISNPPYIPSGDLSGLQREVRDYEPRLALDGGSDGLDCYRRLALGVAAWDRPPRWVGLEVGFGQAAAVAELLRRSSRWERVETVKDWNGIERHVIASSPAL